MMAAVVIERDILTQFFNELEGLNWRENLNWISEFPFEQWHGIDVNAFDKRVEVMDLPFNSLTGRSWPCRQFLFPRVISSSTRQAYFHIVWATYMAFSTFH